MDLPRLMDLVMKSGSWLQEKGIANGRREAEWIFAETLGLTRLELYTGFDRPLIPEEVDRLRSLVTRRGSRMPLAYVLGNQPFHGLRLAISPAVLVPRPETEELVDLVLKELPPGARVLDVGTGSGAIALALKQARPDCRVEASDISEAALAVARANAARLGHEVAFHQGHLASGLNGPFQLVVANLPYIGEDERHLCDPETAFEPSQALFAGADGLDLMRELLADAPRLLAPGGLLWLEHGHAQGPALLGLAARAGLDARILPDGSGTDRFLRGVVRS